MLFVYYTLHEPTVLLGFAALLVQYSNKVAQRTALDLKFTLYEKLFKCKVAAFKNFIYF